MLPTHSFISHEILLKFCAKSEDYLCFLSVFWIFHSKSLCFFDKLFLLRGILLNMPKWMLCELRLPTHILPAHNGGFTEICSFENVKLVRLFHKRLVKIFVVLSSFTLNIRCWNFLYVNNAKTYAKNLGEQHGIFKLISVTWNFSLYGGKTL